VNLLPLTQLHRSTQLDLVERGVQLRLKDQRPVCLKQPWLGWLPASVQSLWLTFRKR
jgi:hypothetical protein